MDKRLWSLAVICGLLLPAMAAAQDDPTTDDPDPGNGGMMPADDVAKLEDSIKKDPASATAEDLNALAQAKGWNNVRFVGDARITSYDGTTIKTSAATFSPGQLTADGARVRVLPTGEISIGPGKASGEIAGCGSEVCVKGGDISSQYVPEKGEASPTFSVPKGSTITVKDADSKDAKISPVFEPPLHARFTSAGTEIRGDGTITNAAGKEIAAFNGNGLADQEGREFEGSIIRTKEGDTIVGENTIFTQQGCGSNDCFIVEARPDKPVTITHSPGCTAPCVGLGPYDTISTLAVNGEVDFLYRNPDLPIATVTRSVTITPPDNQNAPPTSVTFPAFATRADNNNLLNPFIYSPYDLKQWPSWASRVLAYPNGATTLQVPGQPQVPIISLAGTELPNMPQTSSSLHPSAFGITLDPWGRIFGPDDKQLGVITATPSYLPDWYTTATIGAPIAAPAGEQPAPEATTPADVPPPQPKAAPEPTVITHKVLAADNPTQLARIYGVTEADIVKANPGMENRKIVGGSPVIIIGEEVRIPISGSSRIPVDVLKGNSVVYSTATGNQFKTVVTKDANGEPIMAWAKVDADYNKDENAVITEPKVLVKPEDLPAGNLKYLTNPRYYTNGRFDVDPIVITQAAAAPQASPDVKTSPITAVPAATAAQPQPIILPGTQENTIRVNGESYRPTSQPYEGTVSWERRTYDAFGDEIWISSEGPYASVQPVPAGTLPDPISPDQYKTPSAAFANKPYIQLSDGTQITQIIPNKDSSGAIFGVTVNPGTDKETFVPFEPGNPDRPSKEWTIKQLVDYANAPPQGTTVAQTPITGQSKGGQLPIYGLDPNDPTKLYRFDENGQLVVQGIQNIPPLIPPDAATGELTSSPKGALSQDQKSYIAYETEGSDGKTYQLVQGYDSTTEAKWRVLSGYDDVSGEPLWEVSKGPLSAATADKAPPGEQAAEFPPAIVDSTDPGKVISTIGDRRLVLGEDGKTRYWQQLQVVDESGTQVWVTDALSNKVEGKKVHSTLTDRDFVRISGNTGTFWMIVDKGGRFVGLASEGDASILDDIDQYAKAGRFTIADIPPYTPTPSGTATTIAGKMSSPFNPDAVIDISTITRGYGVERHPILGYDKMHTGIDLRGSLYGTNVVASGEGTVKSYGWEGGYGKVLRVLYPDPLKPNGQIEVMYAHTQSSSLKGGDKVTLGQPIATAGSTGLSTGVHVHLEVKVDGQSVDPCRYFCQSRTSIAGR